MMILNISFAGRRRCIGESMAKSNLFLFFAAFMHSFDMETEDGTPPPMKGLDGITLSPQPLRIMLKSR